MGVPITTVSAENLSGEGKVDQLTLSEQTWQAGSWKLHSEVGEYKAAVNWISNGQSQIAVRPMFWNGEGWVEEEEKTALSIVSELGDQPTLMRKWGECSCVSGEMLFGLVRGQRRGMSRDEVFTKNGRFYLDEYGQQHATTASKRKTSGVPEITEMYRFYLPAARFSGLADTPTSSFLIDLDQLRLLRLVLNGKLNARLYMNGVWAFAQSVSLPTQQGQAKQSTFLTRFKMLVTANMQRKNGAADALPIFLQVNTPEVGDVIKQFYPEVKIDEREAELRAEIRNTLKELFDMPVEAAKGLGETSHFGSWTVMDVNTMYSQIPRARALITAISQSWYQATLIDRKVTNPHLHALTVNAAALKGEATSDEARQLGDRGLASPTFMRSRSRAPETAAPTDVERTQLLGWETKNPYLAMFGTELGGTKDATEIDWEMVVKVAGKTGRPGNDAEEPQRQPSGDTGSPDDPNGEVDTGD